MPRKSSSDNIVPLPGRGRPEPPAKLTEAEQKAWRAIVDASPDGFLNSGAQIILRGVVAQVAVADRHAERLKRIAASGGDLKDEIEVAKAHRDATAAVIAGMTALRATPRSRMANSNASRAARNAFAAAPLGRRPWDIEAEAVQAEGEPPEGDLA